MSISVRSHALRGGAGHESLDHRGRRQLRFVDRHLRRVCTGESRQVTSPGRAGGGGEGDGRATVHVVARSTVRGHRGISR